MASETSAVETSPETIAVSFQKGTGKTFNSANDFQEDSTHGISRFC